jgi:hypothetical protein
MLLYLCWMGEKGETGQGDLVHSEKIVRRIDISHDRLYTSILMIPFLQRPCSLPALPAAVIKECINVPMPALCVCVCVCVCHGSDSPVAPAPISVPEHYPLGACGRQGQGPSDFLYMAHCMCPYAWFDQPKRKHIVCMLLIVCRLSSRHQGNEINLSHSHSEFRMQGAQSPLANYYLHAHVHVHSPAPTPNL